MRQARVQRMNKDVRCEGLFEFFAQLPTRFIGAVEDLVRERNLLVVELGEKSNFVQHTYMRNKGECMRREHQTA
jgi:hypothetical protein